ncbi:hypothetical protein MNVM_12120 [Mycobacterium novum]|uniref:Uncharacterized protein n=1 Tax=Mycobacterium novum TaxID=2492438 RepID=A0A7I7JLP3_9MYCO|nr:hypothetical protein MNVM_12120 [Mycobacterium novum]
MTNTVITGIVIPLAPCSGGYYDPTHGTCAPDEPVYPAPFYHRHDNAQGGSRGG